MTCDIPKFHILFGIIYTKIYELKALEGANQFDNMSCIHTYSTVSSLPVWVLGGPGISVLCPYMAGGQLSWKF